MPSRATKILWTDPAGMPCPEPHDRPSARLDNEIVRPCRDPRSPRSRRSRRLRKRRRKPGGSGRCRSRRIAVAVTRHGPRAIADPDIARRATHGWFSGCEVAELGVAERRHLRKADAVEAVHVGRRGHPEEAVGRLREGTHEGRSAFFLGPARVAVSRQHASADSGAAANKSAPRDDEPRQDSERPHLGPRLRVSVRRRPSCQQARRSAALERVIPASLFVSARWRRALCNGWP